MITLFHHAKTRSTRFIFLLEELQVPYQIHRVSTRMRDGSGGADPANPHPHGKVPAIDDGGTVVFESAAIALYLTDKFPQQQLGPRVGDPDRGAYLSWLAYYSGALEPSFMMKFLNVEAPRIQAGWVPVDEAMAAVLKQLEPGPWLLGKQFTAVDVLYGTTFAMFAQSPLLPDSQKLRDYAQRVVSRPAFAKALSLDAG
jgi:glutathione S-transferase